MSTEARRLVRSSAAVGAGTALSRVTGLIRIGATGYALGAARLADAYNTANDTPNVVYELLLGGILSATLVPVFVSCFEREDDEGVSAILTVSVAALTAITVASIGAAPLIFRAYTWHSSPSQARELASVGVPLMRLFLPQILFYGLTALGTALLNARRQFAAPAFAPVLNNVVVSLVLVWFARTAGEHPTVPQVHNDAGLLWLLGLGTTVGIIAMTVVLLPALRRSGVHLRWRFKPSDPAVRRVAALSGWTLGYVAANQVALAVVTALALHRAGDQTAYTYAFVFFQLPHGLFAVSLMTTFVPELSSLASRSDWTGFRDRFGLGLRLLILVIVPASVGYALLARPLVTALLARGSLTHSAAHVVADTLACLAVGLLGFSVYLFTLRGFYALQDTRTPFFLNLGENALNIAIAFAIVGRLHVQGLALSYSAAYASAGVAALVALHRRLDGLDLRRVWPTAIRIAVATAGMAVAVLVVRNAIGSNAGAGAVTRTLAGVVVGVVVYGGLLVLLRVEEIGTLADRLRKRRPDSDSGALDDRADV